MYELKSLDKKFPGVHALKAIDSISSAARSSGWWERTARENPP